MIEQQGRVVAASESVVRVRVGSVAACPACAAGQGCGAGIFGRLLRRKPIELELTNNLHAKAGQSVLLGIPETVFLRLLLHLYMLPLLCGLAGAAIGNYLAQSIAAAAAWVDAATLLGAVLAGGVALWKSRTATGELEGNSGVELIQVVSAPTGDARCAADSQTHSIENMR